MSSEKKAARHSGWKRFLLFNVFPLVMLPFIFLYALAGWWLLTLLNGFPGGFFRQHPNLTVAAILMLACYLLIVTAYALWHKLRG